MNLFTNAATVLFWYFSRYCNKHYIGRKDAATNETLTEKNKNFEFKKLFQLPWTYWVIMSFSLFQSSAAIVFSQNSTELAEKRFNVDSIKAGWYSALSQYSGKLIPHSLLHAEANIITGFFLVPCLGVFIDILGNRATISKLPQLTSINMFCRNTYKVNNSVRLRNRYATLYVFGQFCQYSCWHWSCLWHLCRRRLPRTYVNH